jgi:membrane-associated phospholipid phosphatase
VGAGCGNCKQIMKHIIRENRLLIVLFLVLWTAGLIVCLIYPKEDIHLFLNQFHCKFSDFLFKYLTFLGNGLFVIAVTVLLLFIRFRYAMMVLASYLSSGLLVQVMKRFIFPDSPRPALYFQDIAELYLVPGTDLHYQHSFPSGHAASAFALIITLAMVLRKRWTGMLLLILACLVAYSRVYLSQHFLADIVTGSMPGFLAAFIFYWYFHGVNKKWPDLSIITILQ